MKKMDISTLSDEELVDLFTESYEQQVARFNNIGEFEVTCKRESGSKKAIMEVMICGLAGTPTLADYKEVKIKDIDLVTIGREDKGKIKFKLVPKDTISLNTNDYVVVYKSS